MYIYMNININMLFSYPPHSLLITTYYLSAPTYIRFTIYKVSFALSCPSIQL